MGPGFFAIKIILFFVCFFSNNTFCRPFKELIRVDFVDSMRVCNANFNPLLTTNGGAWDGTKKLYDKYIIHELSYLDSPRIPKIIHQIWLGSPLPKKELEFSQTWKKYHPDWIYILWTDEDIIDFDLYNKEAYEASSNWGERSDIVRYEILERYGGLYVDTDFECLKPFDVLHHICDFFTGTDYGSEFGVYNGLIASCPHHPILQCCVKYIKLKFEKGAWDIKNQSILERTGPYFFLNCISHAFGENDDTLGRVVLFPVTYFYSWPNSHKDLANPALIKEWIQPESFAIHHWHTAWAKEGARVILSDVF